MTVVKVQYAKTHLSELLRSVEEGDEFLISRGDRPVARLVPVRDTTAPRELGFLQVEVPEDFCGPLADRDLAAWEGR